MEEILKLRQEIDEIDNALLELVSRRVKVVKSVGEIKKKMGTVIRDPKREEEMLEKLAQKGDRFGLNKNIIKKIWQTFFEVSYEVER